MQSKWVRKLAHLAQESRREYLRQSASRKLANRLRSETSTYIVQRGPFQGIELSEEGWDEWTFVPKVLGSYESELHISFNFVLSRGYSKILNIGAAEGYYAVGLAKKLPDTTIYAFEKDEKRRSICQRNAVTNNVDNRIHIDGYCGKDRLQSFGLDSECFVLCDIEGVERDLLDPDKVAGLREADILVEIHDNAENVENTLGEEMYDRFSNTHQVIPITKRSRDVEGYEELEFLEWDEKEIALSEHRTLRNGWMFLKSRD